MYATFPVASDGIALPGRTDEQVIGISHPDAETGIACTGDAGIENAGIIARDDAVGRGDSRRHFHGNAVFAIAGRGVVFHCEIAAIGQQYAVSCVPRRSVGEAEIADVVVPDQQPFGGSYFQAVYAVGMDLIPGKLSAGNIDGQNAVGPIARRQVVG